MDGLYKYVKASLATTCLPEVGDGTLRATQPGALNDPFECGVLPGRHGRDDEIARVLTSLNGSTPVSPANVQDARIRYGSLYLRELLAKQLSERFGIVSFASDPRHPLMWAHYTGDGSGFVIGYDKSEISGLARRADCLQPVYYQDRPTPVLAFEALSENNVNAILSFKSHHWLYEDEWRLIVELSETIGTGQVDQFGYLINLLRVPNEAVVSVYYTERTPSQLVDPVAVRLAKPNNRYGVKRLTKLVLSETGYGYMDGETPSPRNERGQSHQLRAPC